MPKFEIDPGYIAGAIDTEGCISISEYVYTRNGSTGINWNPQVIITNTNEHWLRRMRNQCDNIGFIHVDKRTGTAQWRIASDKAADLLNFCKSYLFMKKAQAEVFLLFRQTYTSQGGRGAKLPPDTIYQRRALVAQIHKLNASTDGKKRGRPKKLPVWHPEQEAPKTIEQSSLFAADSN